MDHNKLGLDDSLIEATRAIVEKNLHQNQEKLDKQLDEMKHMGSYTQSHVMKKIKSGDWEATADVKPNRHVELRHHSGKRITVKVEHDPVKEDVELVEGKKWSKLGYSSEHDYHKARYTHASGKKAPAGTSTMAMMVMADKAERESGKKLHEDYINEIKVEHDRYMRSHGKKASGTGSWMFTHKRIGDVNYNSEKDVHTVNGKFGEASKSAKEWAKKHGHNSVYVMESSESKDAGQLDEVEQIDELSKATLGSYIKKAAADAISNTERSVFNINRDYSKSGKHNDKAVKRFVGIKKATDKLTKEQLEEIEALAAKHGLTKE